MATVTNSKIRNTSLRIRGTNHPSRDSHAATTIDSHALGLHLRQYQPAFRKIIGENPTHSLLFSTAETSRNRFFHGGCVYIEARDEIYATSDLLSSGNSSTLPSVVISRASVKVRGTDPNEGQTETTTRPHIMSAEWAKLRPPPNMPLPAGACAQGDGILFCSQGNLDPDTGGLFYMPSGRPPNGVVTKYFGRPFNSPQNVTCDGDLGLWFTDSDTGHLSGIRPKPQVRNHVYRYDAETGDLRVVADDMGRPAGIVLSPDQETMYITDTEAQQPDGTMDASLSATIYAYDVVRRSGGVFLASKRVFASAAEGVPSAVTCDPAGNVYAACGDGVEVWSAGGAALGLLAVPGGCSSICFGRDGELFVCVGHTLWRVQFNAACKPAGE
ncbi:gluconolactonase [Microdochium nivale]|nr:gluconolactonase [Microdochium nivale]